MSDDSDDASAPQIIEPPKTLQSKARLVDKPLDEMLGEATSTVRQMAEDYPTRALGEVETMAELTGRVLKQDRGSQAKDLAELFRYAHEMRGQAGSFGFPLVTRICASLSALIRDRESVRSEEGAVIKAHTDALRAVLANRVTGDGGAVGEEMARGLELAVEKQFKP